LLITPGERIVARNENYTRTAELIAYLIAGNAPAYTDQDKDRLRVSIAEFKDDPTYQLPKPVA
jgi:hypothetical protein